MPHKVRHYAYAVLSDAEWSVVKAQADKEGLSMSDYVRRCVNSVLLDAGDDVPLLNERSSRDRVVA